MNIMKKIIYTILMLLMLSVTSCYEVDNWDAPDAKVHGKVIDFYTGENLLTTQGDWGIRIWERTWTKSVPNAQSLSVMQDGSYNNTKLFKGTYDMLPYGGPFWPIDTVQDVAFNGNTEQNFTVTPYLQLINFTATRTGLKLILKCELKAPIRDGLPNLVELKPFLSLTQFCGASSFIDMPDFNNQRKQFNQSWADAFGADNETSTVLTVGPLAVKPGYTYYVRLGANVNDANRKYNYTEIVKIEVPADAVDVPGIPDNFFTNSQWPFQKADWDNNRWGNLQGWTTNAAMRTRDGRGGYDGGWEGPANDKQSLGFEKWGAGETSIVDGKLYQTFDLPAGSYKFTMSLAGDNPIISNNGSDPRYIVAAEGTTLPDIADISSALASTNFAGLGNDASTSIEFTLSAPKKVSAGFVVSFTNIEQNVRPSWLKLEKTD
jgi:hypothetical protein